MSTLLNTQAIKDADFDDLLDLGFDNFEELPEYITPAEGFTSLVIKDILDVETDKDQGYRGIRFVLAIGKYEEVTSVKLVESGAVTTEEGGVFSVTYGQGAGFQRMIGDWKGVAQAIGVTSPREMVKALAGHTVQSEITLRSSKDKETGKVRYCPSLRNITLSA